MRKLILGTVLVLLAFLSGCTWTQALFRTFGNAYSGGGYTQSDRQADYNRSVDSYGSGSSTRD